MISRTESGPEGHRHPGLMSTETSPDSLNLLMILCSVMMEYLRSTQFHPEEHYSENYSEIAPQFVGAVFCKVAN